MPPNFQAGNMSYFVNENPDPRDVGSLGYYRTKEALLIHHESWYETVGHIVFDENGICCKMVSDGDYLSLVKLKSIVLPDCVERCLAFVASGYDESLYPDKIELLKDHEDYVTEKPKTSKTTKPFWKL